MIETFQAQPTQTQRIILVVTGLSGAGKTNVMRALEDVGFYCVDNLPVPLMSTFLNLAFHTNTNFSKVALGIDARGEQFLSTFISEMQQAQRSVSDCVFKIIFVNAREQTLLKRFQETRRNHPLAHKISIESAIENEKKIMAPIMALADVTLDTDTLNIHDLRTVIKKQFGQEHTKELVTHLISFGFKYGVPAESNLVYDLRFLPNPHFMPALKAFDGRSGPIQEYLFSQQSVQDYWVLFTNFLHFTLNKFYEEGRFFVTVAIGCTGGKHRSIAFVEKLGKQEWRGIRFLITHRDLGKE